MFVAPVACAAGRAEGAVNRMGATAPAPAIEGAALMSHVRALARHVKLSGTPEEAESLAYLDAQLRAAGYKTRTLLHDAFISLPGRASVSVAGQVLRAITQSFSCSSAPNGTTAPLVDVGAGSAADFAGKAVRGCIVLVDGIATPSVALRASAAGAVGQIHVSTQTALHEMCISPVWGSPDPQTLALLPQTVVCTISLEDGAALRVRLAGERLDATLHAEVDTGWRRTPILQADMDGPEAGSPFVLFSGHHDTWHYGVMDNGTANATMVELGRACAGQREHWRRGLRLCFWSGHSHGRFSGSTWYADEHWDELDRRCVAHVNIDSPGAVGASNLANTGAMTELLPLAAEAVRLHAGQALANTRMPRGADMSFSGIGLPAIFGDMSEPLSSPTMPHSPWWHTPDDLLDKVDEAILLRDASACLHGLWALLADPILPFDYAGYARSLLIELMVLDRVVPLADVIAETQRLEVSAETLLQSTRSSDQINLALMRASRALVPLNYTQGDRFTHDLALPQTPFPGLDPIRQLAGEQPASDAAKFAAVSTQRARNRMHHALRQANRAIEEALLA